MSFAEAASQVERGGRLSREQAASLQSNPNLTVLGMLAHQVRNRLVPDETVTYAIGGCPPIGMAESFLDRVFRSGASQEWRATELCLYSLPATPVTLEDWEEALREIVPQKAAGLTLSISTAAVAALCRVHKWKPGTVLESLRDAGIQVIRGEEVGAPGAGALAPGEWHDIHRAAHALGLPTTAGVPEAIVSTGAYLEHLEQVRSLQDESGLFLSFASGPTGRRPPGDPLAPLVAMPGMGSDPPSAFRYLSLLAVTRCFLDNIPRLQANWEAQGTKIAEVALRFGASDFGSTGWATSTAGVPARPLLPVSEIQRLCRDSGFLPLARNGLFQIIPGDEVIRVPLNQTDDLRVLR